MTKREERIVDHHIASIRRWAKVSVHPSQATAGDARMREVGQRLFRLAILTGRVKRVF